MRALLIKSVRPDFPVALSKNRSQGLCVKGQAGTVVTGVFTGATEPSFLGSRLTKSPPFGYFGKMLLFKKKFLDAIRTGEKTQTIRLWKHRQMRTGQRSYVPGIGPIRITAVEEVELAQLTDDDARPDGFPTADQLRAEITQLYPDKIAAGYRAYRVCFAKETDEAAELKEKT